MMRQKLSSRPSHIAMTCVATAVLASACNRGQTAATTAPPLDALPLTSTTGAPAAPAPVGSALPQARPARIARLVQPEQSYAYLDRAYAASDGYADAPPDYAVDYGGERPWVWRGADASERVVERTPEGLRYYYFEPGASEPYLVQDADYAYGYSGDQLVAVYGPDGALQPYGVVQRRAGLAGRYLAWAAGLYAASLHQQRVAVEQAHWQEQRADIAAQRAAWSAQQSRFDAWNAYHAAHAAEEQAHWADERSRRVAEVQRYAPAFGAGFLGGSGGQAPGPASAPTSFGGGQARAPSAPQTLAQGGGYPSSGTAQGYDPRTGQPGRSSLNGYDPRAYGHGDRGAGVQAQVDRQGVLDQPRPDVQVQRQAAEQAHAAQVQRAQVQQAQIQQVQAQQARVQQAQARNAAEGERLATLQQARFQAQAQRQAAEQAHAGQVQVQHAQQLQAQAAEARRQTTLQQAQAQAQVQRQDAEQAHAAQQAARAQQAQVRAEAEAGRQAERGQMEAARAAAEQARAQQAQARNAQEAQRAAGAQAQRLAQQQARAVQPQAEVHRPPPAPPQHASAAAAHGDEHPHDHGPGQRP